MAKVKIANHAVKNTNYKSCPLFSLCIPPLLLNVRSSTTTTFKNMTKYGKLKGLLPVRLELTAFRL